MLNSQAPGGEGARKQNLDVHRLPYCFKKGGLGMSQGFKTKLNELNLTSPFDSYRAKGRQGLWAIKSPSSQGLLEVKS